MISPKILSLRPLKNSLLEVHFEDGERRFFDMTPYLHYPIFQSLQKKSFFRQVKLQHGVPTWPNEADMSPERIYVEGDLFPKECPPKLKKAFTALGEALESKGL